MQSPLRMALGGNGGLGSPSQVQLVSDMLVMAITSGDFDGDGFDDLAFAGTMYDILYVSKGGAMGLNTGNVFMTADDDILTLVSADLGRDGYDDLFVGQMGGKIYGAVGSDQGLKDKKMLYDTGQSEIWASTWGYFNTDSYPDVAFGTKKDSSKIYLGKGGKQGDPDFELFTTYSEQSNIKSIAMGDFNGDKGDDLAFGTAPDAYVCTCRGEPNYIPTDPENLQPDQSHDMPVKITWDSSFDKDTAELEYVISIGKSPSTQEIIKDHKTNLNEYSADLESGTFYITLYAQDNDDGASGSLSHTIEIVNTAPGTPGISISPEDPLTTDDIVISIDQVSSDDDGDPVTYDYEVFLGSLMRDDLSVYNTQDLSLTIPSEVTSKEQVWKCKVYSFDGRERSPFELVSASVKNSAPVLEVISPEDKEEILSLEVELDAQDSLDPDDDELDIKWKSDVDGLISQEFQETVTLSRGDHLIEVELDDGYDQATLDMIISIKYPLLAIETFGLSSEFNENELYEGEKYQLEAEVTNTGNYKAEDIEANLEDNVGPVDEFNFEVGYDDEKKLTWEWEPEEGLHELLFTIKYGQDEVIEKTIELEVLKKEIDPDNLPPEAEAGKDRIVEVDSEITFSAKDSSDPDTYFNKLQFSWDFDDSDGIDEDALGKEVSHMYDEMGTYTVTLTVSDGVSTDTDSLTVEVVEKGTDIPDDGGDHEDGSSDGGDGEDGGGGGVNPNPSPTGTGGENKGSSGTSTYALVGVGLGVFIIAIIVITLVIVLKNRKKEEEEYDPEPAIPFEIESSPAFSPKLPSPVLKEQNNQFGPDKDGFYSVEDVSSDQYQY